MESNADMPDVVGDDQKAKNLDIEDRNTEADDEEPCDDISYFPCKSMEWAVLPKPDVDKKALQLEPVEKFVSEAISSRTAGDMSQDASQRKEAVSHYRAILDLLRKKEDLAMTKKVLLALRSSGEGTTMGKITGNSKRHSNLLDLIFRLEPFSDDGSEQSSSDPKAKLLNDDLSLADAYLNLIVALVSANSVFLIPALNSIWREIVHTDAITPEDRQLMLYKDVPTSEEEKEDIIEQQFRRNARLHGTLSKILRLVPKGKSDIFPLIASEFPFKLHSLEKQACYAKQCFILLNYVPNIRQSILQLCIDKCLEIDVEIRIAQDGKVNIDEKKDDETKDDIFEMDMGGDKEEEKKDTEKEIEKAKEQNSDPDDKVDEMAEKLDTLMYLTFQHLTASTDIKTPRQLYKMIVTIFDSVIITTHRSKFVQFIILFLCGLDGDLSAKNHHLTSSDDDDDNEEELVQSMLSREFAAKLIELILDPFRPTITRQSAACYLASFVARSKFVCPATACEAVSAILRFVDAYMDTYPTESSARSAIAKISGGEIGRAPQNSKLAAHCLFYTVSQAAFYIMCFRGKDCIDHYKKAVAYHEDLSESQETDDQVVLYSDPQLIDISLKRWTRLCSHHLTPLRFCLESVRGEFLLLSDRFDLVESELLGRLIIEDRKMASGMRGDRKMQRSASSIRTAATMERRRLTGGVGGLGRGSNPLDSFFPFDPYLLRRSYTFIDPYYRHWEGSAVASFDEESEDDDPIECTIEDESITSDEEDDMSEHGDDASENADEEDDTFHDDDHHPLSECTPMSLTSTTCESDWKEDENDGKITSDDMAIPKDSWINELRRARAQSIEDCW